MNITAVAARRARPAHLPDQQQASLRPLLGLIIASWAATGLIFYWLT